MSDAQREAIEQATNLFNGVRYKPELIDEGYAEVRIERLDNLRDALIKLKGADPEDKPAVPPLEPIEPWQPVKSMEELRHRNAPE